MNRERTARHRPRAAASRGNFRPTLAWRHDSTPPAWAGLSKGTAPLRKVRSRVFHQGVDSTPAPSNAARLPHCAGMERGDRAALGSFLHGYRSPKLPWRCSARAHNLAIRHSVRPRLISPVHLFWQERCNRCTGSAAGERGQRNAQWFCLSANILGSSLQPEPLHLGPLTPFALGSLPRARSH